MKKIKNNIKSFFSNKENIFFLILFIILTTICYFFPYTHDDWAWGTELGTYRLATLFKDYNGRWMGNILIIALTRNRFIRALTISITLTLIVIAINKLTNSTKNMKYISLILILLLPINILAQAIAWSSGFTNYVIPILITTYFIIINKNMFNDKKVTKSPKLVIPLLILGFINSLFVEHMTIYNLILSIVVTIYVSKKENKLSIENTFYMIGSILGTILMFSNGAYHNIQTATDTYRTIETGNIIQTAIKTYFEDFYKLFIHQNTIINTILCISILVISHRYINNNKEIKTTRKILIYSSITIIIGYLSYILYTRINGGTCIFIYKLYKTYLEGIMIIGYLLALLILTIITIDNKEKKYRIIFEMVSTVIIAAPLTIVTPIGARCFFPTYVMLIIISCEYLNIIFERQSINLTKTLSLTSLLLMTCTLIIYGYSYMIEQERIDYINKNKDKSVLILPRITHTGYMQSPNPQNEVFITRFKEFYGIEEKTEIEFIDYVTWKKTSSN